MPIHKIEEIKTNLNEERNIKDHLNLSKATDYPSGIMYADGE